jgi:hypothetical protein
VGKGDFAVSRICEVLRLAPLLVFSTLVCAQDSTYSRGSEHVADESRLIDAQEFTMSALREESTRFVNRQCGRSTLARLILAPTQSDLGRAVNSAFMDLSPRALERMALKWPSVLGEDARNVQVAQVLCFGGMATLTIRDRSAVSRYQISGTHDSREWSFQGVEVTVVGFSFVSRDVPVDMFLSVKALPALAVASAIREEVQSRTQVSTDLVIRTDASFWSANGPTCDIFQETNSTISGQDFLAKPYLACGSTGKQKGCRVMRPAHAP